MIEMINKNEMGEIDLIKIIKENAHFSMILFQDDARKLIDGLDRTFYLDEESNNCNADIVILSRVGDKELILEPLIYENNKQPLNETDIIYYDTELVDVIDFEKLYANEIVEIELDDEVEESEDIDNIYDEMIEELLANYDIRQAMHEIARIAYVDGRKTLALEVTENMNGIVEE